jgi:hypothetical protein
LAIRKAATLAGSLTEKKVSGTVSYLLLLIAGAHIFRELHLGNLNAVLLYLCLAAVCLLLQGKTVAPGVLLGMVVLFKPHFVILAPLLLVFKRPAVFVTALLSVAAGAGIPALWSGIGGAVGLHREWLRAMVEHNAPGELYKAPNTLQHLAAVLFPGGCAGMDTLVAVVGVCILYAALFFVMRGGATDAERKTGMALCFLACIAAIPNITFTDTEHFLLLLPLIAFVLADFPGLSMPLKALAVVAFVMYGGNWFDVWGRSLSDAIGRAGVLGIGNALIIGIALAGWRRGRRLSAMARDK